MSKNTINILCTTDDNYAPHCGIMLTSLFETNRESSFCSFILVDKISEENLGKFRLLEKKYSTTINIVYVDASEWSEISLSASYLSLASCYRLLAPNLLPQDIHRILYLDCDIIINGDIRPLWETSLEDKGVGAIIDINPSFKDRIGIKDFYFNSGVLLCDLDYWRKNKITEQCQSLMIEDCDKLFYIDQDALNIVFEGSKIPLPLTYNFQVGFLKKYCSNLYEASIHKEILASICSPVIIHYMTCHKPWNQYSIYPPYTSYYVKAKDKSPWNDTPYINKLAPEDSLSSWRLRLLQRCLCFIHEPNTFFESINDLFANNVPTKTVLRFALKEAISRKEPELFWDVFRVRKHRLFN